MQIIVSCSNEQKKELTANGLLPGAEVIYVQNLEELSTASADACLDLQFENTPAQIALLEKIPASLVMVNSVVSTLLDIHPSFVRINGWPTFLSSALVEASCLDDQKKKQAEDVFTRFNKKLEWVPDKPGFITPRIISMIINEAFFALSEGVSTKEEMDTAMKLGTNYPYGPFEWARKIGLANIVALLNKLSMQQSRYAPSGLLLKEFEHLKIQQLPTLSNNS